MIKKEPNHRQGAQDGGGIRAGIKEQTREIVKKKEQQKATTRKQIGRSYREEADEKKLQKRNC